MNVLENFVSFDEKANYQGENAMIRFFEQAVKYSRKQVFCFFSSIYFVQIFLINENLEIIRNKYKNQKSFFLLNFILKRFYNKTAVFLLFYMTGLQPYV